MFTPADTVSNHLRLVLDRRPVVVAQAHFTLLPFSPHQRLDHVVTSDPRWDRHERTTGEVVLGRGSIGFQ